MSGNEIKAAFFARVQGRVQGVGFRQACVSEARRFGLFGWVRNASSGDVEVWAEGHPEKLITLEQWLHRGPPGSRVDAVESEKVKPSGEYKSFRVTY
ncbi:MAG: acylphosphatase [Treponema sp.]|nr:acylphosphatase [Treponema sp.]